MDELELAPTPAQNVLWFRLRQKVGVSERTIENVIQALYASVSDAAHWPTALASLARAFDCQKVGLFRYEGGGIADLQGHNHDEDAQRLYGSYYWQLDPAAKIIPRAAVGEWHDPSPLMDPNSEYMADFAIKHGIRWVNGVKLHEDDKSMSVFGIQRSADGKPFDGQALQTFRRLSPHLSRAWLLRAELRRAELVKGLSLAALDLLDRPVFVVSMDGRLLLTNASAEQRLVFGGPLVALGGVLQSRDPEIQARLRQGLIAASKNLGSAFALRISDARWAAHVVPLASNGGLALIYLCRMGGTTPSPDMLRQLLNFNPSESAVAQLLADGLSVKEIAYSRQVSANTVRSQVRSIFAKARVRRQVDLVKLLATLPAIDALPPGAH